MNTDSDADSANVGHGEVPCASLMEICADVSKVFHYADEDVERPFSGAVTAYEDRTKGKTDNDYYDYVKLQLSPTGPLRTLLEPSSDMQHVTTLLEQSFSYAGDQREELFRTFCVVIDLEYGHSGLNEFFSIIDSNGPCVNEHVSRETYALLSLIDIQKNAQWSSQVSKQCEVSTLTESLYNERKKADPTELPYDIMLWVKSNRHNSQDQVVETNKNMTSADYYDSSRQAVERSLAPRELVVLICQQRYKSGVLYNEVDLRDVRHASMLVISSFAVNVSLGEHIISKNAHKNGWVSGPAMAMEMNMAMLQHLRDIGETPVSIDLIEGAHPADAMDNSLLDHLISRTFSFARDITLSANGSGIRFIGMGNHVNDTLKSTIKETQSSVELTELIHPTTMSSYLRGNNGALNAAAFYDSLSISENKSFSWVGLVLQRGLQPYMNDGKGGVLSSIRTDRAIELITGVPTAVPHTSVMNGCALMQIDNDDMASVHLCNTNRSHLREPLSRSALWLSELGRKGAILSHATDAGEAPGVHFSNQLQRQTMSSSERAILNLRKSHATDAGEAPGVHFSNQLQRQTMSSSERAILSHATDAGEAPGVHFSNQLQRQTMSSSERAILSNATDPGEAPGVHFSNQLQRQTMSFSERPQSYAKDELKKLGIKCDAKNANSTLQSERFAIGEHHLQLDAKKKLELLGYKSVDPKEARSLLMTVDNPMKNAESRAKISGKNNGKYKDWSENDVKNLRQLCKDGYTVKQIGNKIDGHSRSTVHNKIYDLGIKVKVGRHGNVWQVLPKKYGKK